jgi:hypothetical protein
LGHKNHQNKGVIYLAALERHHQGLKPPQKVP